MKLDLSSAGGSPSVAKTCRRPIATVTSAALLAVMLVCATLVAAWSSTADAQTGNLSPVAVASSSDRAGCPDAERVLSGKHSFDPDNADADNKGIVTWEWSVTTSTYSWLSLRKSNGCATGADAPDITEPMVEYVKPNARQIAAYGDTITFRLTVTDSDGASDYVDITDEYSVAQLPTVSIEVTSDGIIEGPSMDGNADNEYDVSEGSTLTLTGTASSGTTSPTWTVLHTTFSNAPAIVNADELVASSTVGSVPNSATLRYVYYQLSVNNSDGVSASAVVKITVHPSAPEIRDITVAGADNADVSSILSPSNPSSYIINPNATATLIVNASVMGDEALTYVWSGDAVVSQVAPNRATVSADDLSEGSSLTASVVVTDDAGMVDEHTIDFLVASNNKPRVTLHGGDTIAVSDGEEDIKIEVDYYDFDDDALVVEWVELAKSKSDSIKYVIAGTEGTDQLLILENSDTGVVTFDAPEWDSAEAAITIPLLFTASDSWGTFGYEIVDVIVRNEDDAPVADAGEDIVVSGGERVRLNANRSYDPDPGHQPLSVRWDYVGISVEPDSREMLTSDEISEGFAPGVWLPASSGTLNRLAGGKLRYADTPFAYFDAPVLTEFRSVTFTFRANVATGNVNDLNTDTDEVLVTVVSDFYSGIIPDPSFCINRSLGGPTTYPHDSTGDGVSNVCSLDTTRRAAIARQNALEQLAILNPSVFQAELVKACKTVTSDLPDNPADQRADACSTGKPSPPPNPVDPESAELFFSGVIANEEFCHNHSLGGPKTYPHDSDGDGVADICALPYTRREAIARQNALQAAFLDPSDETYEAALSLACKALGTVRFQGDHPEDLERDLCALGHPVEQPSVSIIGDYKAVAPTFLPPQGSTTSGTDNGGTGITPGTGATTNTAPIALAHFLRLRGACPDSDAILRSLAINRDQDDTLTHTWEVTYADPENAELEITLPASASNGCNDQGMAGNNDAEFDPVDDVTVYKVTYTVTDSGSLEDIITFTIDTDGYNANPTNEKPVAVAFGRDRCADDETEVLIRGVQSTDDNESIISWTWAVAEVSSDAGFTSDEVALTESTGCGVDSLAYDDPTTDGAEFMWPSDAVDGAVITLSLTVMDGNGVTDTTMLTATYDADGATTFAQVSDSEESLQE